MVQEQCFASEQNKNKGLVLSIGFSKLVLQTFKEAKP
jgi:hypothetical protein